MAKLSFSGLKEVMKQFEEISTLDNGRLAKTMLQAGSKPIEAEWKRVAQIQHSQHYNLRGKLVKSTGQMKQAVASKRVRKNRYGWYVVTYPLGLEEYEYIRKDGVKVPRIRHGQIIKFRNAEKAFYNHYGFFNKLTGKFVQGTRWVTMAETYARPQAEREMQKIWDSYLKSMH